MHAPAHWVVIFSRWMVPRVIFFCLGKHNIIRGNGHRGPRGPASSAKAGQPPPKRPVRAAAMSSSTESVGSRTAHAACGSSFRHNVQAMGCN